MPLAASAPAPARVRAMTLAGKVAGYAGQQIARRCATRLVRTGDGVAAQQAILRTLLAQLAPTAYGRDIGLEVGLGYASFRTRADPRTYEGFAPYLERMKRGEPDVLHPGRCAHFAVSSGTTAGPSKWLPVNPALLAHFRQAGLDSLSFAALRAGHSRVFAGRHLFLGGSTTLQPVPGVTPPIYAGDLSGITALNLPVWVERALYEPGREIAQLGDWPAKLAAIAQRTWQRDITLVAGIPSWLLVLAQVLRQHAAQQTGRTPATLQELWPHLQFVVHGGVPVGPFADELLATYGPGVQLHEVYPASEGFFAAQDAEPEAGLRLMTDHGIFYEFLPLEDYDEAHLNVSDARTVPLEGVRPGVDYVLLLTTPAGLVRYVIGDVVRFLSTRPPRLIYVGRTRLQLSAFGEHVIEKELTDTLSAVCAQHRQQVVDFHVAPLFPDPAAGRPLGRHEWWLELKPDPSAPPPDAGRFATELDRDLAARNDDYAAKRGGGGLALPLVRLVRPGFFETWLRAVGKWGGQSKTPRCRSDRRVADQLAAHGFSPPDPPAN